MIDKSHSVTADDLKALQTPLKERYRHDPGSARIFRYAPVAS